MSLITYIDTLVRERGSSQALRDTLALVREQHKKEVADLHDQHVREKSDLVAQIAAKDAQIEKLAADLEAEKQPKTVCPECVHLSSAARGRLSWALADKRTSL